MESEKTDAEHRAILQKIINRARSAFMVTRGKKELLHGRPMANAQVEPDFDALWFATQKSSSKVAELKSDDHVYLGYTNATGSEWASVNGRVQIVKDSNKIKEVWSPTWKSWFSGPDDPEIVLLKVVPTTAEYWDSGLKVIQLAKLAYAAVTGAHVEPAEHAKVRLKKESGKVARAPKAKTSAKPKSAQKG